jgi:membrane protease YdiL (CAAX protease family)
MAKIEGRRIVVYGFGDNSGWIRFCWGLLSGFAVLSILVGALWRLHFLVFDDVGLHGTDALKFALAWAVTLVIACFYEVVLLRGYLQFTLARGIGFWFAALVLSLLYSFWIGEGRGGLLYIGNAFSLNMFLFLSLWYARSFWWESASLQPGTGLRSTYLVSLTAVLQPKGISYRRIQRDPFCGAGEPSALKVACLYRRLCSCCRS